MSGWNELSSGTKTAIAIVIGCLGCGFAAVVGIVAVVIILAKPPAVTATPKDTSTQPAPKPIIDELIEELQAKEFCRDVRDNPSAASKYQGKMLKITGTMDRIVSLNGIWLMDFKEAPSMFHPEIFFTELDLLSGLKKGDVIAVQGRLEMGKAKVRVGPCVVVKSE